MAAINCPICRSRVNAGTAHCPECGADPRLPPDTALADLQARGLSWPVPRTVQPWTLRRRLAVILVGALAVIVLLAPLWLGYFGPRMALYAQTWLPWRSHLVVYLDASPTESVWSRQVTGAAQYEDAWPWTDESTVAGPEYVSVTVNRLRVWLPWVVTERHYRGG